MATAACTDERIGAHFTYSWEIKSPPSNVNIFSPVFTVQSMEMTKWCLCMSFNRDEVTLWIERAKEDGGPEVIEVKFELSMRDPNGSWLTMASVTQDFPKKGGSEALDFPDTDALFDERGSEFFSKYNLAVRCRIWRIGTRISKSELCFASTHFDVYKPSCVWAVKGFSCLQRGEKKMRILNSTRKGWPQLILVLSVVVKNDKECVIIHLKAPGARNVLETEAEFAFLDADGTVILIEQASTYLGMNQINTELKVFEKSKLISNGAVILSDDVLFLRCELKITSEAPVYNRIEDYKLMIYSDLETVHNEKGEVHFGESETCPFKEMVNEFKEDGILTDVSLRAGNRSFPAHQLVLSSRSPVFRSMFTKDMIEKTSKCVDIPDLDADTLSRLLLYIYESKVEELEWKTAANLFKAADKFKLLDLKEKCSCVLKLNLTKTNVCDILVLVDVQYDESLKKSVQKFILNNSEILYSDLWKSFREDHSKLALETEEEIIYSMKHSRS